MSRKIILTLILVIIVTVVSRSVFARTSLIAELAGLGGVRFHDLRHTFASLALLRGAKPKVISEALGHASVVFTMDTYSHIISGMQEDMMELLDDVLPSGIPPTTNERQGVIIHDHRPA